MKVGFVGAGNMASAIIRGMISKSFIGPKDIFVSDIINSQCQAIKNDTFIQVAKDNIELVQQADVIVMAVKPVFYKNVLEEIRAYLEGKIIISIVTGWSHDRIKSVLSNVQDIQIVCVMPNMPVAVGEGMTAIISEHSMNAEMFAFTKSIFDTIGRTIILPQRLLDGIIALSGSGPAYVYMFIEAMADAAVKEGLSRSDAYQAAAQTVKGAAEMLLKSGQHPGMLKDAVCSPGGTTIEAVIALEKGGMRATVMDAIAVNANKARHMRNTDR